MPRALRIEYPGAIYHVMNRGDRRESIFRDNLDHETFRKELLENIGAGAGEPYRADARRETTEEKARRILNEEPDKLGWTDAELAARAKGDARKIGIAKRLRDETAITLKWIAKELHMGTWTHVANRLSNHSKQPKNQPELILCQK